MATLKMGLRTLCRDPGMKSLPQHLASIVRTIADQASLLTTLHISRLLDLNARTDAPLPTLDDNFFSRCVSAIVNDALLPSTALKHLELAASLSIFWSLAPAEQQRQFVPSGYSVPSDVTHSLHAVGPKNRPLGMTAILDSIAKQARVHFVVAKSMNLRPRISQSLKLKVHERADTTSSAAYSQTRMEDNMKSIVSLLWVASTDTRLQLLELLNRYHRFSTPANAIPDAERQWMDSLVCQVRAKIGQLFISVKDKPE